MSNFKFHLVTVVGIFLALALGIFIGSTFTEEGIIIQQRGTIERMREDIDTLEDESRDMQVQAVGQAETIELLQDWLGELREVYWLTNPVDKRAVLIHGSEFSPEFLGTYLSTNVVQTRVILETRDLGQAEAVAEALILGDASRLTGEGITVVGDFMPADYVLLAFNPDDAEFVRSMATNLVDAEMPVIALGTVEWQGLADLVNHRLYASVSHLDTPLGLYCLGSILQGQGGHYGPNNLLPAVGVER